MAYAPTRSHRNACVQQRADSTGVRLEHSLYTPSAAVSSSYHLSTYNTRALNTLSEDQEEAK